MEGDGSEGGTVGGEESGGPGLSFCLQAVVFIHKRSFAFVGGHSCWQAVVFVHGWGVMSWVLIIHVLGSSSSVLLFLVVVAVLGAGLSFASASSSFVGGRAHSWVVYIFHGWGAEVCGQWSSYMCEGSCFVMVL